MAAHLTDKQKKKIIADRANGLSLRQLAAKYGTSTTTIHRVIGSDPETERKVTEKKEENTKDILKQLDARTGKVMQIIDLGIDALLDPVKFDRAGAQSIATTLGILIDKYTNLAQLMNNGGGANNELLQSLHDLETRRRDNGD